MAGSYNESSLVEIRDLKKACVKIKSEIESSASSGDLTEINSKISTLESTQKTQGQTLSTHTTNISNLQTKVTALENASSSSGSSTTSGYSEVSGKQAIYTNIVEVKLADGGNLQFYRKTTSGKKFLYATWNLYNRNLTFCDDVIIKSRAVNTTSQESYFMIDTNTGGYLTFYQKDPDTTEWIKYYGIEVPILDVTESYAKASVASTDYNTYVALTRVEYAGYDKGLNFYRANTSGVETFYKTVSMEYLSL